MKINCKYQRIRNECLLLGVPGLTLVDESIGHEEDLALTLEDIQAFIEHSYDFGMNPLPHLRDYFPGISFGFYEIRNSQQLQRIAMRSDYVLLKESQCDWSLGVIALEIEASKEPKRLLLQRTIQRDGEIYADPIVWPRELTSVRFVPDLPLAPLSNV